jgi:hypothetical protein
MLEGEALLESTSYNRSSNPIPVQIPCLSRWELEPASSINPFESLVTPQPRAPERLSRVIH